MEIAYSKYFKSYIKLIEYKTDDEWTFMLCNKKWQDAFLEKKSYKSKN